MRFPLYFVAAAVLLPAAALAQAPARDITGYWELRFDSASVTAASLVQPVTQASEQAQLRHDNEWTRYCVPLGVPYIMSQSPLDIRQSPTVTAMVSKPALAARSKVSLMRLSSPGR